MLLQRPCVNAEKFDGCHPDHPREFCRSSAKFCSRAVNARERTHSCLRSNTEFLASRCLTIQVAGTKKYVSGEDPLLEAVVAGNTAAVTSMLSSGANARAADENGVTLVMLAAATGNAELVRMLLAAGADPTARDRSGRNAADRARDAMASGRRGQFDLIVRMLTDE